MAGLEEKYIKSMLPAIEDTSRDTAILNISTLKEPVIISIPETEVTDLLKIVDANNMYAELNRRFALTHWEYKICHILIKSSQVV